MRSQRAQTECNPRPSRAPLCAMPTHVPGAVTTGHELLTAQRLTVSTKRMDSAAAVKKPRENNTWNNMVSAHTCI